LVKYENGYLLANFHNNLIRWKNCFCWLLNVHGINDVRHTEIHAAEPLVPASNSFEVEIATENLSRYNPILAQMIQLGYNKLHSEIHQFH
jgi:hypothetical protein